MSQYIRYLIDLVIALNDNEISSNQRLMSSKDMKRALIMLGVNYESQE